MNNVNINYAHTPLNLAYRYAIEAHENLPQMSNNDEQLGLSLIAGLGRAYKP